MIFNILTKNCLSTSSISSSFRFLSISPIFHEKFSTDGFPKKPPTPWINFYSNNYPAYRKSFPDLSTPELMRKISSEWSKVPEAEKSRLQALYLKEKENYAVKLAQVPQEMVDKAKDSKKSKHLGKQKKSAEAELKSLFEKLKKPKKPLSAYMLYTMDRRPKLSANLSSTEKVKQMAAEWRQLSKQTKELYERKNKELLVKYEEDLEKWSMKMFEEGKNEEIAAIQSKVIKIEKSVKNQKSPDAELKSLLEELKKPKKPLSSYLLYTMDRRPKLPPNLSSTEKVKQMAAEWGQLSKQTKVLYEMKNKELMAKYEEDLEKWSMKMYKEGKNEEIAAAQSKVMKLKDLQRVNKLS